MAEWEQYLEEYITTPVTGGYACLIEVDPNKSDDEAANRVYAAAPTANEAGIYAFPLRILVLYRAAGWLRSRSRGRGADHCRSSLGYRGSFVRNQTDSRRRAERRHVLNRWTCGREDVPAQRRHCLIVAMATLLIQFCSDHSWLGGPVVAPPLCWAFEMGRAGWAGNSLRSRFRSAYQIQPIPQAGARAMGRATGRISQIRPRTARPTSRYS